jgi:hypothetical protein
MAAPTKYKVEPYGDSSYVVRAIGETEIAGTVPRYGVFTTRSRAEEHARDLCLPPGESFRRWLAAQRAPALARHGEPPAAKPAASAPKTPRAAKAQQKEPSMSDIKSKLAGILADLTSEQLESVVADARRRLAAKSGAKSASTAPRVEDIDPNVARVMGLAPAVAEQSSDTVFYCKPANLPRASQ